MQNDHRDRKTMKKLFPTISPQRIRTREPRYSPDCTVRAAIAVRIKTLNHEKLFAIFRVYAIRVLVFLVSALARVLLQPHNQTQYVNKSRGGSGCDKLSVPIIINHARIKASNSSALDLSASGLVLMKNFSLDEELERERERRQTRPLTSRAIALLRGSFVPKLPRCLQLTIPPETYLSNGCVRN